MSLNSTGTLVTVPPRAAYWKWPRNPQPGEPPFADMQKAISPCVEEATRIIPPRWHRTKRM